VKLSSDSGVSFDLIARGATVKVIGLREKAVKRKPFQEKNQFNENWSKRKNDLTKTGRTEKTV